MAPKSRAPEKSTTATPAKSSSKHTGSLDAQHIAQNIWDRYVSQTPQRVKLLDSFLAFLAVVGVLQFVYCILVGNFVSTTFPCLTKQIPPLLEKYKEAWLLMLWERATAIQRLPIGIQRHRRPVRAHGLAAHADEPGKQGRLREHFARAGLCRFRLRLPDPALLLHQLHKLISFTPPNRLSVCLSDYCKKAAAC